MVVSVLMSLTWVRIVMAYGCNCAHVTYVVAVLMSLMWLWPMVVTVLVSPVLLWPIVVTMLVSHM